MTLLGSLRELSRRRFILIGNFEVGGVRVGLRVFWTQNRNVIELTLYTIGDSIVKLATTAFQIESYPCLTALDTSLINMLAPLPPPWFLHLPVPLTDPLSHLTPATSTCSHIFPIHAYCTCLSYHNPTSYGCSPQQSKCPSSQAIPFKVPWPCSTVE